MDVPDPVRRRVFAPHALGADEFLRVTWHETKRIAVFSVWSGAECTAAVPVRVSDLGDLATLLRHAIEEQVVAGWPAPDPASLVVPTSGFEVPPTQIASPHPDLGARRTDRVDRPDSKAG